MKGKPDDKGHRRVQFEFSRQALERFDRLKEDVDVRTRAELVRRALGVFEAYVEAEKRGARPCFREKDGTYSELRTAW